MLKDAENMNRFSMRGICAERILGKEDSTTK